MIVRSENRHFPAHTDMANLTADLGSWADEMEDMPMPGKFHISLLFHA